jgi:high-affinity iron transporter
MSKSASGRMTLLLLPFLVGGVVALFLLGLQHEAGGRVRNREEKLPPTYVSLVNPLANNPEAVQRGWGLFADNCATCHGESANGRGPASLGLNPPPANFSQSDLLDRHSDAYLFYRITEGKIGTAMPSFHGSLTPEERWQIVCYLRTL